MTAPAAGTTPAPGATAAEAPKPMTFADVMAKVRAKAQHDPPREAPKPPPEPVKVTVPGDDASLKRISRLEADNLAANDRIKQLQAAEADATLYREVTKLWGEGKKMEALGKLAKGDPTGEMEELLAAYLESGQTPETEAELAAKADSELARRVEAMEKDRQAEKTAAEAKERKADGDRRFSFALQALDGAKNDDGSPRFELCGRRENRPHLEKLLFGWVDDKGVEQPGHVQRLAIKQQVKSEDVTPDLARKLILEAYADIEAELEAEGVEQQKSWEARYGKKPAAAPAGNRQPQTPLSVTPPGNGSAQGNEREPQPRPMQRPTVRTDAPPPAHSLDAVLAKNRERARY